MKRMVLVAMGLMLLAGSAFAQPFPGLPDTAYVGLFADAGRTVRSVTSAGTPVAFTMYIYWLPSKGGMLGADFRMSYPSNVVGGAAVLNPAITLQMGDLTSGLSVVFNPDSCMSHWVWSHHQSCFLINTTESEIMVIENPNIVPFPAYQVLNCDYSLEPVKRFTHLYMNWDGGIAVEEKSWGAIKSLFK